MPDLRTPIDNSWNVTYDSKDGNYSSDASGIRCTYPKNGYASNAGTNFRASPRGFPCATATLSYDVKFSPGFDFVKGGKLPGFWGGEPGSSGGDWNGSGWSARVMFREKGSVVAYVYMCTDQGSYDGTPRCSLSKKQGAGFDAIAHHTNGAGIDLWRDQGLQLKVGEWNAVSITVALNSPGKSDGRVSLTVNGRTKSFDGIRWCESGKKPINGIMFATWMGGGSSDYAPSKTQHATFRNVRFTQ